jgi:hypothetical protein
MRSEFGVGHSMFGVCFSAVATTPDKKLPAAVNGSGYNVAG